MLIALILLVIIIPLIVFLGFIFKHLKLRKSLIGTIPCPRSFPFIGHALIIKPDIEGFVDQIMGMAQLYPHYPRMVLFWIGPVHQLMIYSAELAETIFTNPINLNKGMFYDMLVPWLGQGLLTSKVEKWRPRRKLLTPTFHYDILKNFVHIFNSQSEILIKQLQKQLKYSDTISDVSTFISLCTLDVICETSMGQSVNAQLNSDSQYVRAVLRINDIIQRRIKNPMVWLYPLFWLVGEGKEHAWALDVLHSFTRKVIVERRTKIKTISTQTDDRLAFLDLLLEMERDGHLNEDAIQHEVDTFMFEGHDTTSTAITWALHLLGNHPDIQEKVYNEVIEVCGHYSEVTFEHLTKLKYTECCIKEVLRLYPSAPIISRRLGSDIEIGGAMIPADTQVIVNIFLIHRDPQHWPDPEIFNPDRFLPENSRSRHAFAYVPFSAGSRNCIGQRFALMEEKVILAWILRKFSVQSLKRRDELRHKTELILRPSGPVPIRLTNRQMGEKLIE